MFILELLKTVVIGIVEGITEWLPVSSTGHMILVEEFIKLDVSPEFWNVFLVVIQLGSILAVVVMFWNKIFPFEVDLKKPHIGVKKDILGLWGKILLACVPAAVIGILFDDIIDKVFYNTYTVITTLIFYGVVMIVVEYLNKNKNPKINKFSELDMKTALIIGGFQLLALIPGTSRSGATIIGALIIGVARTAAAEFTFYLAIPVMFGASLLKMVKFGFNYSGAEIAIMLTGMVTAFVVSMLAIKFLINYVRKRDFKIFGWYRIGLGLVLIVFMILKSLVFKMI